MAYHGNPGGADVPRTAAAMNRLIKTQLGSFFPDVKDPCSK